MQSGPVDARLHLPYICLSSSIQEWECGCLWRCHCILYTWSVGKVHEGEESLCWNKKAAGGKRGSLRTDASVVTPNKGEL